MNLSLRFRIGWEIRGYTGWFNVGHEPKEESAEVQDSPMIVGNDTPMTIYTESAGFRHMGSGHIATDA